MTCPEPVKDIEQNEETSTTNDNIIEKALMLSPIDLENSIDNVDDINIRMCNMSLSTSDKISSFYVMPRNEEDIITTHLLNTLIARTQKFTSISTTVNISFILRH